MHYWFIHARVLILHCYYYILLYVLSLSCDHSYVYVYDLFAWPKSLCQPYCLREINLRAQNICRSMSTGLVIVNLAVLGHNVRQWFITLLYTTLLGRKIFRIFLPGLLFVRGSHSLQLTGVSMRIRFRIANYDYTTRIMYNTCRLRV